MKLTTSKSHKRRWQLRRHKFPAVALSVIALLSVSAYAIINFYGIPHDVEVPRGIEEQVVSHYSHMEPVGGVFLPLSLTNVKVLTAKEGRLTKEMRPPGMADTPEDNRERVFCVCLLATVVDNPYAGGIFRELDSNPSVFNVYVWRSYSGRLKGTILSESDLRKGASCPDEWDAVCPFTCDEHQAFVRELRIARKKAIEKEEVRKVAEAEVARKRKEEAK
jgi:hypothetical protein